uniref:Uncharacterized protein n=1 Tax=Glycine max TaxID=3847 RepID=C6TNF6_SOYBN|nr:unknown [Glycine max]
MRSQQILVQKQRRRKPLHLPPEKPSFLQTKAQLWSLLHKPWNPWLCDSHTLPSVCTTTWEAKTRRRSKKKKPHDFLISMFTKKQKLVSIV